MDFKTLVDTIFTKKHNWPSLNDTDKESLFFIFNRYMGKKYPKQAHFFNDKNMDKATCMDIWYQFLQKETKVPFWFWKGPTKKKDPEIKDWKIVRDFYEMNIKDIYLLCEMFPKEFKEEIKRLQQIEQEQQK